MRITFLDLSLFLYVFGAFVVSKIEGISLLTNIFLIVLLLTLAFSKRNKWLRFSWFQGLSIVILALSFASAFWSYDLNTSLVSSISFSTAIIGGGAIALTLSNGGSYKAIVAAALIGSAILVISAWRELTVLDVRRAAGLTGNANDLGISLTIAAFLMINPVQKSKWVVTTLGLGLVSFALFTTGSRKMLIVFAVLVLYFSYVLFSRRNTIMRRIPRNMLLLVIIMLFIAGLGEYIFEVLEETEVWKRTIKGLEGIDTSANTRSAMIDFGFNLWKQRPFLGYGIDQFRYYGMWNTYSHNNYVEILINFGIVGLIIYYFVHIKILIDAGKHLSGKYRWFVFCVVLLLLLWDVAFVSYRSKLVWVLIASLVWTVGSGRQSNSLSTNS